LLCLTWYHQSTQSPTVHSQLILLDNVCCFLLTNLAS
jgi:hypothetical protein